MINAHDLRNASFPVIKSGYDPDKVDAVNELCAQTIESLEKQILALEDQVANLQQSVALARAEAAPMEIATDSEEDTIAQWLTTIDPLEISQEVQKNIAEAIVESTMAASHIRSEAKERVKTLINAVADEVHKLVQITKEARISLEAASHLQENLSIWQGAFAGRINLLLEELQLPWTVQVSQLAKVLAHMAEKDNTANSTEELNNGNAEAKNDSSNSSTVSGEWA